MVNNLNGSAGGLGAVYWPEGSDLANYYGRAGTNFSLYAPDADCVVLCLFKRGEETQVLLRRDSSGTGVWSIFILDCHPGQEYLFRVHGEINPRAGLRFNPTKALLDPYARGVSGTVPHCEEIFGYPWGHSERDLAFNSSDSGGFMPKCIVMRNRKREWKLPFVPVEEMVIYEAHVVSATKEFPGIPPEIQGTYAALGHPAFVAYLNSLGVTTLELMPLQYFGQPGHLLDRGLKEYWGYNPLLFFVPHAYSAQTTDPEALIDEVSEAFRALAEAGIEVILDVVYNHTFEGNELGPTLCYRGIANRSYYLPEDGWRYYKNWTGTGNVLNLTNVYVRRLVIDSLCYWVDVLGVSGFRFDLASALTRSNDGSLDLRFLSLMRELPTLRDRKLIMEPWDASDTGYNVGGFTGFQEWNGPFRDGARKLVKGGSLNEFIDLFGGSRHIYGLRGPHASINYVTCHDGFTLTDLVSYNNKHNEENGENNRDGNSNTCSWNCGYEGETDDPQINQLRRRQRRNFLTVLLLSQGVPMIRSGDEVGQSYGGNNNAYCQERLNIIRWAELLSDPTNKNLQDFVAGLIGLRREHAVFKNSRYGDNLKWFGDLRPGYTIGGVFLDGSKVEFPVRGSFDSFIILFNFYHQDYDFVMPTDLPGGISLRDHQWRVVVNTWNEQWGFEEPLVQAGHPVRLQARSIKVLQMLA